MAFFCCKSAGTIKRRAADIVPQIGAVQGNDCGSTRDRVPTGNES
jgi:hypothetical protein